MRSSFYETKKRCFIYLLLLDAVTDEDPYFFVGKTFSNAISKTYSKHIHRGYATTKNVFTPETRPKLYILQDILLTEAEAYRYIIGYTRFFLQNKLGECLNYEGTVWQSEYMKPETEIIYQAISKESVEELLRRTYVVRPIDADRRRDTGETQGAKNSVQLNVTVYDTDRQAFDAYCKQLGTSRREGFGVLLNSVKKADSAYWEGLLKKKDKQLEKQQKEMQKMEKKLALAEGRTLPQKELWASAFVPFIREGINQYMRLLFPKRIANMPIKSRSYKSFTRTIPLDSTYQYPEFEGFYLVKLHAITWGKNHSCFYMGIGDDGVHYKFRYFAKDYFCGLVPYGSGYDEENSWWLLGCRKANDGAMELAAAFPMAAMNVATPKHQENTKPSLREQIAFVEKHKGN